MVSAVQKGWFSYGFDVFDRAGTLVARPTWPTGARLRNPRSEGGATWRATRPIGRSALCG